MSVSKRRPRGAPAAEGSASVGPISPPDAPSATERHRGLRAGRRPLRLTSTVFTVVAVLVVALVATATATGVARMRNSAAQHELSARLVPAQLAAAGLTEAYVDQEAEVRGFLLSGEPAFLAPYTTSRARAQRRLAELSRLLADDPQARRQLGQVAAAGRRWQSRVAQPAVEAWRAGPVPPAEVAALQARGRAESDRLRVRLAALERATRRLSEQQVREIAFRQSVANVVGALAVLVGLLAAALWVPVLRRLLVRPLERLESQVQTVAAGAYDREISSEGPAEVRTIATAVEAMRENIVRGGQDLVDAQHQLTLRDERDRMAADLHDLTIQRVFALGLALSSAAVRQPRLAPLLEPLVEETDAIIRELRGVIFGIRSAPDEGTTRHRVADLVRDSARGLGFTPALEFSGPVDSACDDQLTGEVLAVLREALSNVARHAQATRSSIRVAVDGSRLTVAVDDDGVGLGDVQRPGHGLGNLRRRATRLGGDVTVESAPGAGTSLLWQVPLTRSEPATPAAKEA